MVKEAKAPIKKRSAREVEETATSSRPKRVARGVDYSPPGKRTKVSDAADGKTKQKTKTQTQTKPNGVGKVNGTAAKSSAASAKRPGRPSKTNRGRSSNPGPNGVITVSVPKTSTPVVGGKTEESDDEGDDDDRSYWLMKAEPESRIEKGVDVKFSIDDLRQATEPEPWDGVRNAAARNNMRAMRKGDLAFFYHSNCKVPGIAGLMEIVKEHSVDESAFDPKHPYYDAKSTRENPKWEVVHVEFRSKFKDLIKLTELKSFGKPGGALENLPMLKQSRLSVSPVPAKQWKFIMGLAEEPEDEDK